MCSLAMAIPTWRGGWGCLRCREGGASHHCQWVPLMSYFVLITAHEVPVHTAPARAGSMRPGIETWEADARACYLHGAAPAAPVRGV